MHTVFNNIHSLLNKKIDSIFALLDVFKLLQSLVYMSYNKNVSCQNIRETEQKTSLKHEIFTHCHSTVIVIALVGQFKSVFMGIHGTIIYQLFFLKGC